MSARGARAATRAKKAATATATTRQDLVDERDVPQLGRLVLANGRTVAHENTNSTHHFDVESGETVPVVAAYYVEDDQPGE